MKFGLNYSQQAEQLVRTGRIDVDTFKCPEWPDLLARVASLRPCYPHFAFRAGRRPLAKTDWAMIDASMRSTGAPHINMHLAPSIEDFPGMALESEGPEWRARLIEAMVRDVEELAAHYPRERIVLENVMWDPLPPWSIPALALRPEVIRAVVEATGCRFLLDLSHAAICARYFREDERAYIERLPVERLRELHLSGLALGGDGLWCDHQPMSESDWQTLDWALARIRSGAWPRPEIATLEYGWVGPGGVERSSESVLLADVPRARERLATA